MPGICVLNSTDLAHFNHGTSAALDTLCVLSHLNNFFGIINTFFKNGCTHTYESLGQGFNPSSSFDLGVLGTAEQEGLR